MSVHDRDCGTFNDCVEEMSHHDKFFFSKDFLCIDTDTAPKLTIILEVLKTFMCCFFFPLFSYLGAMWVVSKTIPF